MPIIPATEAGPGCWRLSGIKIRRRVATLPPGMGAATLEKIAINALMAGCLPDYLPVIVSALKAMSDERFSLRGVQTTTHPCSPWL